MDNLGLKLCACKLYTYIYIPRARTSITLQIGPQNKNTPLNHLIQIPLNHLTNSVFPHPLNRSCMHTWTCICNPAQDKAGTLPVLSTPRTCTPWPIAPLLLKLKLDMLVFLSMHVMCKIKLTCMHRCNSDKKCNRDACKHKIRHFFLIKKWLGAMQMYSICTVQFGRVSNQKWLWARSESIGILPATKSNRIRRWLGEGMLSSNWNTSSVHSTSISPLIFSFKNICLCSCNSRFSSKQQTWMSI